MTRFRQAAEDQQDATMVMDATAVTATITSVMPQIRGLASRRAPLQNVLTCLRAKTTLVEFGRKLFPTAERCRKTTEALLALFALWPDGFTRRWRLRFDPASSLTTSTTTT
ncbi:hypothetical protein HL658_03515 [Azospirillum sp. RWY-5-1]|uniref:Uncharacterized protein n=1 Tax=Azospirillum oleiclasticum TaxID=2735135 RepID=A0ABX2T3P5_9PROT|nr:hypothetical protein [Azospirillum oleiclasticum]NYZ11605.1 hypothetical protein [Azospirillum oleiclasticum]NYZ18766.1 hypothetical protein [Azospirillum oleiclasticum]